MVDTVSRELKSGDTILLCSDGLNGLIFDDAILERVLAASGDLEKASRSLVDAANAAGGDDNITVVLLRLEESPSEEPGG